MSDPRKTFRCIKCGMEINDMQRTMGKDTQCENCIQIDIKKKEFLEILDAGRKIGCDLDGDIINGKYHHILNEAREFDISLYFIINGIEAPDWNVNNNELDRYIKRDIELTEKLSGDQEHTKKPFIRSIYETREEEKERLKESFYDNPEAVKEHIKIHDEILETLKPDIYKTRRNK